MTDDSASAIATIASSQGYASKASALDGVESVRTNALDAPVVEV